MEEHGGRLVLEDAPAADGVQGARVTLLFDKLAAQSSAAE
jgi:nitrogen fixation/metabolism regulation signal transduction histidine kinase